MSNPETLHVEPVEFLTSIIDELDNAGLDIPLCEALAKLTFVCACNSITLYEDRPVKALHYYNEIREQVNQIRPDLNPYG